MARQHRGKDWPGLRLRPAERGEGEHLAAIAFEAWQRDLRPYLSGPAADSAAERHRLKSIVTTLFERIIVAESAGVILGFGARSRGRAYIPYLFVAPNAQNRGIGTLLLHRLEALFELEGQDRVELDTLSDNVRAVRFYQHQGYRILALKRSGATENDETSVRLEKQLSPYRGAILDEDGN
jgi:ribosomal-protein-alanine N-acetyltransferase